MTVTTPWQQATRQRIRLINPLKENEGKDPQPPQGMMQLTTTDTRFVFYALHKDLT